MLGYEGDDIRYEMIKDHFQLHQNIADIHASDKRYPWDECNNFMPFQDVACSLLNYERTQLFYVSALSQTK